MLTCRNQNTYSNRVPLFPSSLRFIKWFCLLFKKPLMFHHDFHKHLHDMGARFLLIFLRNCFWITCTLLKIQCAMLNPPFKSMWKLLCCKYSTCCLGWAMVKEKGGMNHARGNPRIENLVSASHRWRLFLTKVFHCKDQQFSSCILF